MTKKSTIILIYTGFLFIFDISVFIPCSEDFVIVRGWVSFLVFIDTYLYVFIKTR